jgi:hypothetical protein
MFCAGLDLEHTLGLPATDSAAQLGSVLFFFQRFLICRSQSLPLLTARHSLAGLMSHRSAKGTNRD